MQKAGENGQILSSALLISSNGCVNPVMKTICALPPVFEPPLSYRLGFRAVLFQGMKSGDQMQMSVRMIGCVDPKDCALVRKYNFLL